MSTSGNEEVITTDQLDAEEAETQNFATVERNNTPHIHNYDRLCELLDKPPPSPKPPRSSRRGVPNMNKKNHLPPLHAPSPLLLARQSSAPAAASVELGINNAAGSKNRFRQAARRVQIMNGVLNRSSSTSGSALHIRRDSIGHRQQQASRAQDLLESIQQQSNNDDQLFGGGAVSDSPFLRNLPRPAENLVYAAAGIKGNDDGDDSTAKDDASSCEQEQLGEEEMDGLLLPTRSPSYGSVMEEMRQQSSRGGKKKTTFYKRWYKKYFHPVALANRFWETLASSFLVRLGLPLFGVAWILYYVMGNPRLVFMPGHASLTWWADFVGRQVVTLELARLSQWLVLDLLLLNSTVFLRCTRQLLGPLVTMTALQARGWPFLLASWACWDLVLLHGDGLFQEHWFGWTELSIYTQANSGSYILQSQAYLRILLSMIVAGLAVTGKRMLVSVRFGRRMLAEFKPRMEKLLADLVIISEIGEIAEEAEYLAEMDGNGGKVLERPEPLVLKGSNRPHGWTNDVTFEGVPDDSSSDEESEDGDKSETPNSIRRHNEPRIERTGSGRIMLQDQMEQWVEPVVADNKSSEATLHDVLKFKRALAYMDETHPFGDAFGPANDRSECIESSHSVYWRLLKFTPETNTLNFDVLALVATDEYGSADPAKMSKLRRLFQPDARNELSLLAFVQSCDSVYKKLRYFRASVSNSSAIDKALESIFDGIFWFILILTLLTILQFNPYPILVSITSLLVSVSFALGSSVSKYVEGVLLIAVRRPFDLGDRIVITKPEDIDSPGAKASWFVEDISLFSTTLRYAKTNEVSTLNNYSISLSRIVNLQRSSNAIVQVEMLVHESVLEGSKFQDFRSELEQFVCDRPRTWEGLVFCRHDDFDANREEVSCTISFRHRSSWQNASRINQNRAVLLRFIHQTAKKMGIQYSLPMPKRAIFQAGAYEGKRGASIEESAILWQAAAASGFDGQLPES